MERRLGDPETHVTRVYERGQCVYVEGKVLKKGSWLDAAFVVHKPDILQMDREQFMAFAKRRLPEATVDLKYDEKGTLVA